MRWVPGMCDSFGNRVITVDPEARYPFQMFGECLDLLEDLNGRQRVAYWTTEKALRQSIPDLSDPATLGCLLAQAREAWRNNGSATETTVGWRYYSTGGAIRGQGPSEGEAIAAAILAAPDRATCRVTVRES